MLNFIYKGLVAGKCDGVLGETLGVDDDELASLFRSTFRLGTIMDNFQMSLAWQCHRGWGGGRYRFEINFTGADVLLDGHV